MTEKRAARWKIPPMNYKVGIKPFSLTIKRANGQPDKVLHFRPRDASDDAAGTLDKPRGQG